MSTGAAVNQLLITHDILRSDQRSHRRYPISLDVQYRLRNTTHSRLQGKGRTSNISSGGVFFRTSDELPAGSEIVLLMQWPVLLDGECPLKLVVHGRIVRSGSEGTAIRALRHEFRTTKRPILNSNPR